MLPKIKHVISRPTKVEKAHAFCICGIVLYFFLFCASRVSRKGRGGFPCLVAILLFASCQSYKKVPYLQDAKVVEQTAQQENLYDAKIMPKDLLTIVVSCTSPELAVPFNLTVATQNNEAISSTSSQPIFQQYLVDNV